ncbi:MAG TPA: class I SAM-dependent methyltransferase [Terriglobales bacterium]|jgi:SAM-dependent methyltransferase
METAKDETWPGVADEILAILRCTLCRGRLRQDAQGVVCLHCAYRFPLVGDVLRFVDAEQYAGSFGYQWLKHKQTQLDNEASRRSETDFTEKTGFTPDVLRGKLVLDVGCGMGRYAEVVTRWGAHVVCVDLSHAVEAAAQNLARREAVILQADVFSLPFAPESFDLIYSLGVLHHTPDCRLAFERLPPFLKPGGKIAVWLYSAYNPWYRASDFYRVFTRKMKPEWLHRLCSLAVPLYHVHSFLRKVPLLGRPASGALRLAFPMSFNPDPEWRVLDTFDWYSAYYQSKHTYEEVLRWFEACGLQEICKGKVPISVQGTRPMVPQPDPSSEEQAVERCAG